MMTMAWAVAIFRISALVFSLSLVGTYLWLRANAKPWPDGPLQTPARNNYFWGSKSAPPFYARDAQNYGIAEPKVPSAPPPARRQYLPGSKSGFGIPAPDDRQSPIFNEEASRIGLERDPSVLAEPTNAAQTTPTPWRPGDGTHAADKHVEPVHSYAQQTTQPTTAPAR